MLVIFRGQLAAFASETNEFKKKTSATTLRVIETEHKEICERNDDRIVPQTTADYDLEKGFCDWLMSDDDGATSWDLTIHYFAADEVARQLLVKTLTAGNHIRNEVKGSL